MSSVSASQPSDNIFTPMTHWTCSPGFPCLTRPCSLAQEVPRQALVCFFTSSSPSSASILSSASWSIRIKPLLNQTLRYGHSLWSIQCVPPFVRLQIIIITGGVFNSWTQFLPIHFSSSQSPPKISIAFNKGRATLMRLGLDGSNRLDLSG